MYEWILVMTLHLRGAPGDVRDASPVVVSGFTSEERCNAAMKAIGEKLIVLGNRPRKEQGERTDNFGLNSPIINSECLVIRK